MGGEGRDHGVTGSRGVNHESLWRAAGGGGGRVEGTDGGVGDEGGGEGGRVHHAVRQH